MLEKDLTAGWGKLASLLSLVSLSERCSQSKNQKSDCDIFLVKRITAE